MLNEYLIILPYMLSISRFGKAKTILIRTALENIIVAPVIIAMIIPFQIMILVKYIIGLILTNVLLTALYEIQYIINDTIVSNYEDKPSYRKYNISISMIMISRILYSIVIFVCLLELGFSTSNIFLAISLLFLAFLFHNLELVKLRRAITFPLVRLARYLFIPLVLVGQGRLLADVMIAYIPLLISETISGFKYNAEKYGCNLPEIRYPWFYVFGIFLPIQLLLVSNWYLLGGNILLVIMSFFKNTLSRALLSRRASSTMKPYGDKNYS